MPRPLYRPNLKNYPKHPKPMFLFLLAGICEDALLAVKAAGLVCYALQGNDLESLRFSASRSLGFEELGKSSGRK